MKRKTHNEFINELKNINSNIKILGEYKNSSTKIQCECLICENKWKAKPSHLLSGHGCPECAKKQRAKSNTKTHEQFIVELTKVNPNIKVLNKYKHSQDKILCECLICQHQWEVIPQNLLRGYGCPECSQKESAKARIKTHEQFIDKLMEINSNIKVLERYEKAKNKILCECLICQHQWSTTPNDLLNGHSCTVCKSSKGELKILKFLQTHNITYVVQKRFDDCRLKQSLPFDFYLPKHNICIEYDGEHHFRVVDFSSHDFERASQQFEKIKLRDEIKTQYCKENNIKLLRIPYWDFDNIENILKKEILHNEIN